MAENGLTGALGSIGHEGAHAHRCLADDGHALDAEGVALLQRLEVHVPPAAHRAQKRVETTRAGQAPTTHAVGRALGTSE